MSLKSCNGCREILEDVDKRLENAPTLFVAEKDGSTAIVSMESDLVHVCNMDKCIDVKGDRIVFEEVKLLYDVLGFKIRE